MPAGAKKKEERDRVELADEFNPTANYRGMRSDVSARIVSSERRRPALKGSHHSPNVPKRIADRKLPIPNYDRLGVPQIAASIDSLSKKQLQTILDYERQNKNRKTLLQRLNRSLSA